MPQDPECHIKLINARVTQGKVLIALGGNVPSHAGTPILTLKSALTRLADSPVQVESVSRFYATPCFPAGTGPDYVNAAAVLSGSQNAEEILEILHRIEDEFGRARDQRWGRRTLDLDLIALGDMVLPDLATWRHWHDLLPERQRTLTPDRLILPHPRLQDRAFVLVPLNDVASEWRHPVSGASVAEMLVDLDPRDVAQVRPVSD